MVLSRRERIIAVATGVVLGAVGVYSLFIEPWQMEKTKLDAQIASNTQMLRRDMKLIKSSKEMNRTWNAMAAAGLKQDQSEAESQLVHSITEWAQDAGLTLPTQQAGRTEREKDFNRMTFRATGTGSMSQISRFLYRIETASIPVRVADLTISSRKDGTDELSLAVGISTIYPARELPKPSAPAPDRGKSDE